MSYVSLALGAALLVLLLGQVRRSRSRSRFWLRRHRETVSLEAMSARVGELATTLRGPAMVIHPTGQSLVDEHQDKGHIWASPSGKKVYMN